MLVYQTKINDKIIIKSDKGVNLMKLTITNGRHTLPSIIACMIIGLALPVNTTHAGFLVQPVPVPEFECLNCIQGKIVYKERVHKKHYVAYKHFKRHRCHYARYRASNPACMQTDFVTFIGEPAPLNRGRWVNTDEYDYYDPDLATGDDDPTVYPGMNIDN